VRRDVGRQHQWLKHRRRFRNHPLPGDRLGVELDQAGLPATTIVPYCRSNATRALQLGQSMKVPALSLWIFASAASFLDPPGIWLVVYSAPLQNGQATALVMLATQKIGARHAVRSCLFCRSQPGIPRLRVVVFTARRSARYGTPCTAFRGERILFGVMRGHTVALPV